jgi:hypothetical protein
MSLPFLVPSKPEFLLCLFSFALVTTVALQVSQGR